mgnify:CR=1 FL=1
MKQARIFLVSILTILFVASSFFAVAKKAAPFNKCPSPVEIVWGDPSAPVVIIEYSSITCGHCASFAKYNFPKLSEEYIKKGQVFYIIREFPLDVVSLNLAQIIFNQDIKLCKKLRETLLLNQEKWLLSKDPKKSALNILRPAGITSEVVAQSEGNATLKKNLLLQRVNCSKMDVDSTPTFFIYRRGGSMKTAEQIDGFVEYAKFQRSIEKFLKRHDK